MTRFFLNTTQNLVSDAVDGFLRYSSAPVAKLDVGSPDINIVVRPDWTKEKSNHQVALISGGGSGHEPMHAGFVGEGMLTAAVCGGLFASPSIDAVLSAILHVAGEAGVLVIVKAYTGDCLNFGLAVEKAKSLGVKVEMVIFSDDISIPDHPRPRGLAGTILLHKVCGYYATKGKSLSEIKAIAEQAKLLISTIGVSITSCTTPSSDGSNRVEPGHCEVGLGIHGEPGVETVDTQNATTLVNMMVKKLREHRKGPLAAFLNNLGGVSNLEMSIICSALLEATNVNIQLLIGPASLCTSLDMKGFSITFFELKDEYSEALLAPVNVHSWVTPVEIHKPLVFPARNNVQQIPNKPSKNEKTEKILKIICDCLIENEENLNHLDSFVGDGDTGFTFATGARRILSQFSNLPFNELPLLLMSVSDILSKSMGGSSGVLLSILTMQAATSLREGKSFSEALISGVNKMMELGGAKPGMRTMIDALLPAVESLKDGVAKAAEAAEKGAEATKTMLKAGAGRSSYLNADSLKNHVDPGASAVALAFRALAEKL
ncbi:DAK2 domain-containing protein [Histomonas meleagridis]|uniref:DAK2 domain-containing protein n=1 Tax=Histomonas meleagridis TaxID=135588 RepID=UPI003559597E|nr:DAK2 domain-containing protein [Histomonas meleagridis]KAH0804042.1 DAK2 domain-containing protein [Histomonas meleagridis]